MPVNTFSGASGAILESITRSLEQRATLLSADMNRPFLNALLANMGEEIQSTKHEWQDYELAASTVTTATGAVNTTGDTTIGMSADMTNIVYVGDILRVEGTREKLQVTAVSSTDLTVTRGFGGTTKATIPSATTLTIVGRPWLESADYADEAGHTPTQRYNYTQIFRRDIKISGSLEGIQLATALDGANNQLSIEVNLKMREILKEMAGAVIDGVAPASVTQGSSSVRRSFNGIVEQVREGSVASSGAIYTDIASSDFNQNTNAYRNLVSNLKSLWDAGSTADTIVVNSRIKEQLSVNVENGREQFGLTQIARNVQSFSTPWGDYRIMLDNNVSQDTMVVADMGKLMLHPLAGRRFSLVPLAKTGDSTRLMIVGEFTLVAQDAATGGHAVFYNAAA